jgi:hypothetical protein
MEKAIYEENYRKFKIEIFPDDTPENPRNWDNLGEMVCFHSRYNLGDKHNFSVKEIKQFVEKKNVLSLPLYLYDHSGITISTNSFNDRWDSGQIGYIYITRGKIRKEKLNKKTDDEILEMLKNEVKIYNQYLTGDIYGFMITGKGENELDDSCWGYYGENDCIKAAKDQIDFIVDKSKYFQMELPLKEKINN